MCSLRYFLEDNVHNGDIIIIIIFFFLGGGGGVAKISNNFWVCVIFQIFFVYSRCQVQAYV